MFFYSIIGITLGAAQESSEMEKQAYKQELNRIKSLRKSLKPGPVNDLKEYEKLADEIQGKWVGKNKEYYVSLMLEICKPLSSGRFDEDRQFILARKYALLALSEPNQITIDMELELIEHVMTDMATPRAPKDQEWAQQRRKDVEIRLHAWKRLIDAIDTIWDPNDLPVSNVVPPLSTGLPSGVAPEAIKDPKLRAKYEAAIEENRQKAERYGEQYKLRKWLKRFPQGAERYIIQAYSKPQFNLEELKQYLKMYAIDEKTQARILDDIKKNMEKQIQKESSAQ